MAAGGVFRLLMVAAETLMHRRALAAQEAGMIAVIGGLHHHYVRI